MNFFSRRKNDAVLDNLSERSDQTCSAKSDDPEDDVRDETPSHCRDATPRAADDRHVSSFTGTNASAGSNTAYAREGIGDPNEPPSPVPAAKPVNSVDAAVNISDHVSSGENNIPLTSGAPSSAKDGSEGGVRSAEKSETSMDIDQEAHRRDLPGCVGGSSSSEVSVKAGVSREEVSARNDHNDNRVEDAVKNAGRHRGANSSTTEPGGESGLRGDVIDDNNHDDDDLDNTLVVNMEAADTGLVEDAHLHHDRHRNQTSDKTSVTLSVPKPTPSTPSLCPVFSTPRNQQHQQQTSLDIPPSVSTVLSAMSQKQYYQAVQTPSLPPSASSSLSSSCPSDVPPPLSPSCPAGPCIPAAASHSRSPSSATLTPSAKLESQHVLAPCPLEETTASVTQEHGTSRSAPAVVKTKQELGLLPTSDKIVKAKIETGKRQGKKSTSLGAFECTTITCDKQAVLLNMSPPRDGVLIHTGACRPSQPHTEEMN
ncbi:hypothetical protein RRG08_036553 [Elysia crispata]|uniref:Uncharacterized protein n=1 Tax=Elysia crispata TaxID=231223 RepID=A0AAE1CP88_9GAST|nr:hypothetical protein RRG08_036553 [Elysia crispata]